MKRKITAFLFLLAISVASGCAHLQKGQLPLGVLSGCPQHSLEAFRAWVETLNAQSPSEKLSCALNTLRQNMLPVLRNSSLGAKLCLWLAERRANAREREMLAAEGIRFAEEALRLGAVDDGEVYYYLAINLGLATRHHITLALENLNRLHESLKKAFELAPDEDVGGPARVLGMLYLKAPPWPRSIGDGDKALELLSAVAEKHPAHPLNHLFYAQALWEVEGRGAQSEVERQYALGLQALEQPTWSLNRPSWRREFAEFSEFAAEAKLPSPPASP